MNIKHIYLIIIFGVSSILPKVAYSQFCANPLIPPVKINGIEVTDSSTGFVSIFSDTASSCIKYFTPTNSIWLGPNGLFTYTLKFDKAINKFDFVLNRTGTEKTESFTFTTNSGIPTIKDNGSCFSTIVNNVITSGLNATVFGGGGHFTLFNDQAFETLTISGPGEAAGSFFAICDYSVTTKFDTLIDVCKGDSVLIGNQYQKESGIYIDTILGGNSWGGDSIITITLNKNSVSFDLGIDTTMCLGDTLKLDANTPNASYLWQDNSTQSIYKVFKQGIYWVEVTVNKCKRTDTIQVNYIPSNTINFDNNVDLCLNDTLVVDVTNPNAKYLWQDSSTNSIFKIYKEGIYWVEISFNNCRIIDTIIVAEKKCEIFLEMPNVFTPNNDGINDLFIPSKNIGISSFQFTIYNRWGVEIYKTVNHSLKWDGFDFNEGIYFWTINYTDINGNKDRISGNVTLLR